MGFRLPSLKYPYSALEPYIDRETMQIHHSKHHAGYVKNLEQTLKNYPKYKKQDIKIIIRGLKGMPSKIKKSVQNNGGGHTNHSLFWEIMTPKSQKKPSGNMQKAIDFTFGDFDRFKQRFSQEALTRFGSGWTWLVIDKKKLKIISTANQDSPLTSGRIPILGIDVWEHAYYLKYQNRRVDYVDAWWNVVNWKKVESNYGEVI